MAPHLDHETRLLALDLLPGIGYCLGMQRHRADALEALAAGSRDEDEVRERVEHLANGPTWCSPKP